MMLKNLTHRVICECGERFRDEPAYGVHWDTVHAPEKAQDRTWPQQSHRVECLGGGVVETWGPARPLPFYGIGRHPQERRGR